MNRIQKQMSFLYEIDLVKDIFRQSLVVNGKRRENDAEHSWHMAMVAITLKEYFIKEFNLERSLKMILIHDLVEIYAGDTPAFGKERPDKFQSELDAAKKLFSLLPKDQEKEMLDLWIEFEECTSNDAIYANVCDKYQGFMQNITSNGHTWEKFQAPWNKVLERASVLKEYVPQLYKEHILPEFEKYKKLGIIR